MIHNHMIILIFKHFEYYISYLHYSKCNTMSYHVTNDQFKIQWTRKFWIETYLQKPETIFTKFFTWIICILKVASCAIYLHIEVQIQIFRLLLASHPQLLIKEGGHPPPICLRRGVSLVKMWVYLSNEYSWNRFS